MEMASQEHRLNETSVKPTSHSYIRDFILLAAAISYFSGILLILIIKIFIEGYFIDPFISLAREFAIAWIILAPISVLLIAIMHKLLPSQNRKYRIKTIIYSIYSVLIILLNQKIAMVLFLDVLNKFISFAILSVALFILTEITYYPILFLTNRFRAK